MMALSLSICAYLALVVLPGAWITFGLRLGDLPFWARLCSGAMLAPVVVAAEFYVLRLFGLPFESIPAFLVVFNLPALVLIVRNWRPFGRPRLSTLFAIGTLTAVMVAASAPFLFDSQLRTYTWEAWSQADVVYSLANGQLLVEDAELAGVRLSYPWAGHVYQAVLSYLLGSPPVDNYIWANVVWVPLIFAFTAGVVAEFGGNALSRVSAAMWLAFGVNFVGYVVGQVFPTEWIHAHPILGTIWGDNRYTPFLDKVVFFGQMWFALGLFSALVYVLVRPWKEEYRRSYQILIAVMLCGIGVIYPVLLPAAFGVVGARGLVALAAALKTRESVVHAVISSEITGLALGVIVSAAITFAQVRFLTEGRASSMLVQLNSFYHMRWTAVESVIVLSPLLLAFLLKLRDCWRTQSAALTVLGIGALLSSALYVLFDIPWYRNEYKFMFTAAICLAPFPSLVLERMTLRLGTLAVPAIALLATVLSIPLAHDVYANTYTAYTRHGPATDDGQFDLRLAGGEDLAQLTDAIRASTPTQTILVTADANLHLPTLTRRQLYVAPLQADPHPGILITSDQMLTLVKGYPLELVEQRRSVVNDFFQTQDPATLVDALERMLAFGRPLAVVIDDQCAGVLRDWLPSEGIGRRIYSSDNREVWLIDPGVGIR
jgi:hypothetical protein